MKSKAAKEKEKLKKALEKKQASQRRSIQKQREKQIAQQSCPEYRDKIYKQRQASAKRSYEKQKVKQSTPQYKEQQAQKAKTSLVKSSTKARESTKNKVNKNNASITHIASKPIKSKGLAGVAPTKNEKEFHDMLASLGCICCMNKGYTAAGDGAYVSIHHCDGRTKKDCHKRALPLCQWHHDVPPSKEMQALFPDVFPIHAKGSLGGKKAWERVNGTQEELMIQTYAMLGLEWVDDSLLEAS
jgi:hypothetical protein